MGGGAPAAWGFFGSLGAGSVEDFVSAALPDDVSIGEGFGEKSFVGKKLIGDHPELSTGAEGGHGGGHEFMTEQGIRLTALVEWGVHDHGIERRGAESFGNIGPVTCDDGGAIFLADEG